MVSSSSNSINSAPHLVQKYLIVAKKGKISQLFSWYERLQITELNTNLTEISQKKKKGRIMYKFSIESFMLYNFQRIKGIVMTYIHSSFNSAEKQQLKPLELAQLIYLVEQHIIVKVASA